MVSFIKRIFKKDIYSDYLVGVIMLIPMGLIYMILLIPNFYRFNVHVNGCFRYSDMIHSRGNNED